MDIKNICPEYIDYIMLAKLKYEIHCKKMKKVSIVLYGNGLLQIENVNIVKFPVESELCYSTFYGSIGVKLKEYLDKPSFILKIMFMSAVLYSNMLEPLKMTKLSGDHVYMRSYIRI